MHLHLPDFPEQVGCEDEVVEGFVVGGDDLVFCSLPFFNTFFDEDDVFPIFITEFMSWVLITVVILYSVVISWIRSSISRDVLGSSPELSVAKRYLGFNAIARAIAARFIIPPLISDGYRCSGF